MATITSTPTATSLSVNGNSAVSGSISWSLPNIPSGATVVSRILTGTVNVSMSKGTCRNLTVNGTSVTAESGTSFEINLGANSTTTSITTSATGNNKNANGTVSFTNLVYTVTYSMSHTVTFVDWNGTVLKTQTVEEGNSATPPSNPTRSGYIFIGWDKSYNNITSNLTITAQYEQVSITLDKTNVTLEVGQSTEIKAEVSHIELEKGCVWSVSNSNVELTVDSLTAIIKGIKEGTSILYCKSQDGSIVATCNISITPPTHVSTKNINIGETIIDSIYIGNAKIEKIYLGNTLIYEL